MQSRLNEETAPKLQRVAITIWALLGLIGLVAFLVFLMSTFKQIFALFFYTIALVYLLRPLVNFFEKRGVPRLLAVILTYLIVMLIITLLLLYLIPIVVNQGTQFVSKFPGYLKAEIQFVKTWRGRLIKLRVPPSAIKSLEQTVEKLREAGLALLASVPGYTLNVFSIIFFFVLAPFLAFYLLKDLNQVKETVIELIPARYQEDSLDIIHKVDLVLSGFLRGQFLVALSVGTLASIIFTILGVDFSVVLGMIVGVLNIVPYFGPLMGGLIAAIVAFFKAPILAVWVILAMMLVSMIDSTLLSPNIMSQQVNLHPVLIAFSLLIGGSLLGVLGVLIAIPSAAVGKAIVYHFLERAKTQTHCEDIKR